MNFALVVGMADQASPDTKVGFLRYTPLKGLCQTSCGFRRAREENDARDGAIQTMHNAKEDGARLIELFLDPNFGYAQQALVAALVGDNGQTGGLVEYD